MEENGQAGGAVPGENGNAAGRRGDHARLNGNGWVSDPWSNAGDALAPAADPVIPTWRQPSEFAANLAWAPSPSRYSDLLAPPPASAPPYPYEGDLDDAAYERPLIPTERPVPPPERNGYGDPPRHAALTNGTPINGLPAVSPTNWRDALAPPQQPTRPVSTPPMPPPPPASPLRSAMSALAPPEMPTVPPAPAYDLPAGYRPPNHAAPDREGGSGTYNNVGGYAPGAPPNVQPPSSVPPSPVEALPQRVPAKPDVPTVPEPPAVEPPAETPELARIATHLRRDDVPTEPRDRTEGFDVDAVLAAVRGVPGVRDASLRTTQAGAHSLRLDLADGADPALVSREVARLLQEKLGLAAAPQDESAQRLDEPTWPGRPSLDPPSPEGVVGAGPRAEWASPERSFADPVGPESSADLLDTGRSGRDPAPFGRAVVEGRSAMGPRAVGRPSGEPPPVARSGGEPPLARSPMEPPVVRPSAEPPLARPGELPLARPGESPRAQAAAGPPPARSPLDGLVPERPAAERPSLDPPVADRPGFDDPLTGRSPLGRPYVDRPSLDRPSPDAPPFGRPSLDQPAPERAPRDRPSLDRPSFDRPTSDQPGYARSGYERPGYEPPGYEPPGMGRAGIDRPRPEWSAEELPPTDQLAFDGPRVDRPPFDRPQLDRPQLDRPQVDQPVRDRPGMGRSGMDRPPMGRPAADRPSLDRSSGEAGPWAEPPRAAAPLTPTSVPPPPVPPASAPPASVSPMSASSMPAAPTSASPAPGAPPPAPSGSATSSAAPRMPAPPADPPRPGRRRAQPAPHVRAPVDSDPTPDGAPVSGFGYSAGGASRYRFDEPVQPESRPLPTGGRPGPRVVIDNVQVSTFNLDATVEVRLGAGAERAVGFASGPAVESYILRLCAVAASAAVDELLANAQRSDDRGRCFVEHAAVVPFGSTEVAVVVLLLVCNGWVEQLSGSAPVVGDTRQAMVRATLAAVNRRLEALL